MPDREKLIELLTDNLPRIGGFPKCDNPLQYTSDDIVERIADHLILNGVTIQRWIPVTERLPQESEHPWTDCEVVQVLLNDGTVTVGYCERNQRLWYHLPLMHKFFVGSSYEKTPVVAWQPLAESSRN